MPPSAADPCAAPNACAHTHTHAHAPKGNDGWLVRSPPLGSTTILPGRNRTKERKKERKDVICRDRLSPGRRSIPDLIMTPRYIPPPPPDILLSLLFIANFTPPESSRHSARVVITAGEQCDSTVLHGGPRNLSSDTNSNIHGSIPVFLASNLSSKHLSFAPVLQRFTARIESRIMTDSREINGSPRYRLRYRILRSKITHTE